MAKQSLYQSPEELGFAPGTKATPVEQPSWLSRAMGWSPIGLATGLGSGPLAQYSPIGMFTNPQNNELAKLLGVSGEQGEFFQPGQAPQYQAPAAFSEADLMKLPEFQSAAFNDTQQRATVGSNATAQNILAQLGLGNMSVEEAMRAGQSAMGDNGALRSQFLENMATDPLSGSRFATEQVQRNPLLAKALAGMEGLNESLKGMRGRADAEEQQLASRGFSLQPEDYEAYGQASGDLARLFGTQEQDLAQSLAARGLSAGASGAALAGYAGLQGNKMEQLAGLQRKIANDRMNMNLQRLSQTRDYLTRLNQQEQSGRGQVGDFTRGAIQDQFGRQLAGAQNAQSQRQFATQSDMQRYRNDLDRAMGQNQQALQQANQRNIYGLQSADQANRFGSDMYGIQQGLNYKSLEDKRANKGFTLADALGRGLYKGVEAAPGAALQKGMTMGMG